MSNHRKRATLAVAVVLASIASALTRAETLEDAWAQALQQDRGLAAVRSQAEAAELDAGAARAERWPTVAVGGTYTRLDDAPAFDFSFTGLPVTPPEIFRNDTIVMGSAMVTVPLFTSGRISSTIAAAQARSRGAGAQVAGAAADLKLAVADAYVGVLRARRMLAVAESSVASFDSLASDVGNMFERELVPKNDWLAVQVAAADAQQRRLRAVNALQVALAVYNRRLGEPMERPADLADTLPAAAELPVAIDALIELAVRQRTELTALGQQAEAYGAMAKAERSRTLPQLALTGGYSYLGNRFLDDQEFLSAGIGVQWALFDGGQSRKRAAALDRSRRAADEQRQDAQSLIALQVRQAWLDVEESRDRMKVTARAVEQAEENQRIAREQYGAGLGTQTQLLQAESLRVQALTNRDNAVLDAGLSKLKLARAVGSL